MDEEKNRKNEIKNQKLLKKLKKINLLSENTRNFDYSISTEGVTEEWTIKEVATKRCPYGWENIFKKMDGTFDHIQKIIDKEGGRVVPLRKDIFNAFHWCSLRKTKVVIVGQDPYYTIMNDGRPDAVGASFSTRRDARLRESVQNIFVEVKNDYPEFKIPNHGDLSGWAKQGVLLLNASLTTIAGIDKGHPHIWDGVINEVFAEIKNNSPHAIILLWGRDAQKQILPFVGKLKYLTSSHPSPKSAKYGFFGCSHFKLTNEHLISKGIQPIDWTKLEE